MGKIRRSPRYVIYITETDLLCLFESGGGVNSEKLEKKDIFNLRRSDRILMKFEVWKDIMSQSNYFKSRLYPVTLG